ncbi:MAG TPA: Hsp20/alpha crystallin family protein [Solirubrobacteraceae bacterium]
MATMVEPFAPWMRDLSRFLATPGGGSAFLPPADVLVREDGVTVYMDVPGLHPDELEIELEQDMLTVRGERRPPWDSLDGSTARIERAFGRFERTLRVTHGLDPDAIEASLDAGVLQLHLPKPQEHQPRKIEIKPGSTQGNGESAPGNGAGATDAAAGQSAPDETTAGSGT